MSIGYEKKIIFFLSVHREVDKLMPGALPANQEAEPVLKKSCVVGLKLKYSDLPEKQFQVQSAESGSEL